MTVLNEQRLAVRKTYKMLVGGAFVRSESGRSYEVRSQTGELLAHAAAGSRKDVRDAVRAARTAGALWAERTAYNRGQILYRVAEITNSRRGELIAELEQAADFSGAAPAAASAASATASADFSGDLPSVAAPAAVPASVADADSSAADAAVPATSSSVPAPTAVSSTLPATDAAVVVDAAIDRWVWYAGWCDKFPQVLGGSNPVAGPYFNFTVPEPMGVVGLVAPSDSPLLGLISRLAPALVSGNAVVVLACERSPLPAVTLAEILVTSDIPPGVVNILTGRLSSMLPSLAGHGSVDCLDLTGCDQEQLAKAERLAAESVTRVVSPSSLQRHWSSPTAQSPYIIGDFCEYKTVWHPKGQ